MLTVDILEAQNRRLREENDELRETLRQMREAEVAPEALPPGVPYLTVKQEKVLRLLLGRRGIVEKQRIYDAVYDDENVSIKMVDMLVFQLRRKLHGTSIHIVTDWGRGYHIDRGQQSDAGQAAQLLAEAIAA